ncbi:MAG: hypothetical protein V9G19_05230 [Tetrasphaera sp.]
MITFVRTFATAMALTATFSAGTASATAANRTPTARSEAAARSTGEFRDLITLALTTAPFHDVDNALRAGWTEQPMCMTYPEGFHGEEPGTMGNHFYNVAYLTDGGHVEASQPELLLYEKRKDGSWRLNAVEYVIPAGDLPGTATPPELFGQKFTFYPEVGAAGIWGLHVWLWRHNPRGMYVNLHPTVTCAYADIVGP